MIQRRHHLGRYRRVVQDSVQSRPYLDTAGDRGNTSHHRDGFQAGAPMAGVATKAAPFAHCHHKIEALRFGQERRVAVLGPAAVQWRRRATDDPATIRHGKEDAEFLHAVLRCGGRIVTTASNTSDTNIAKPMKNGVKLPMWSRVRPASVGATAPTV